MQLTTIVIFFLIIEICHDVRIGDDQIMDKELSSNGKYEYLKS